MVLTSPNLMTFVFDSDSVSCCCRIFYLRSTSTLSVLNAYFSYDSYSTSHPTFSSLDDDSVATLVHVCVTSRVDYCGSLLIGSLKKTTKKLQHVLNSAARIVSNTRKFDRGLTHFRRSQLHYGCCRPGSVHSLRPGVQMSAQGSS